MRSLSPESSPSPADSDSDYNVDIELEAFDAEENEIDESSSSDGNYSAKPTVDVSSKARKRSRPKLSSVSSRRSKTANAHHSSHSTRQSSRQRVPGKLVRRQGSAGSIDPDIYSAELASNDDKGDDSDAEEFRPTSRGGRRGTRKTSNTAHPRKRSTYTAQPPTTTASSRTRRKTASGSQSSTMKSRRNTTEEAPSRPDLSNVLPIIISAASDHESSDAFESKPLTLSRRGRVNLIQDHHRDDSSNETAATATDAENDEGDGDESMQDFSLFNDSSRSERLPTRDEDIDTLATSDINNNDDAEMEIDTEDAAGNDDDDNIVDENGSTMRQGKIILTAEEEAIRKSELSRRRKYQSLQRAEDDKNATIQKLLKKQASKRTRKENTEDSPNRRPVISTQLRLITRYATNESQSTTMLHVPASIPMENVFAVSGPLKYPPPTPTCDAPKCDKQRKYKLIGNKEVLSACSLACYTTLKTVAAS